jgi:hypothetical protein
VPTSQAHSISTSNLRISFSSRFEFLGFHTAWVTSVVLCDRWRPIGFRYASLATRRAALQKIAKGQKLPSRHSIFVSEMVLRWANLILAILAALPPIAHVLELPNKLAMGDALWLAVQQQLYRGWGPFLGGPAEVGALATTLALVVLRREHRATYKLTAIATLAYATMLIAFFVFNAPVNEVVNSWTPATLPGNWTSYRIRWEVGHALAAVMSVVGLAALGRAHFIEVQAPSIDRGE